jgi:FKBP-type peptidyl-prolyl cis-trans isomerase 2
MAGSKLITILVAIFIIYSISSNSHKKYGSYIPPIAEDIDEDNSNQTPISESNLPEIKIKIGEDGSFIERKFADVFNTTLNSEEGRDIIRKIIFSSKSDIIQSLRIPREYSYIKTLQTSGGKGTPVECGQKVHINYTAQTIHDIELDNEYKNKEFIYVIGQDPKLKPLDYALIGMKQGQKIKVIEDLPLIKDSKFQRNNNNDKIMLDISLLNYNPLPTPNTAFKIFDDNKGGSKIVGCGKEVTFDLKINKLDGNLIYDSKTDKKPFSLVIGDENVPYGINKALINTNKGNIRTVIMPPEFAIYNINSKKVIKFYPSKITIPNEMMIFTIEMNPQE